MGKIHLPFIFKKGNVRLGTAYNSPFSYDTKYNPTVLRYFSVLTPEVAGGYWWVYGREFGYGWSEMDELYKFALKNNKKIHYAHLRWWFKDQPPDIYAWIKEAITRYPKITDWTVCNEAWDFYGNPAYDLIGESFAFVKQERPDIRRFYNGLLYYEPEQTNVKHLIDAGLVDAVGLQMHINVSFDLSVFDDFLTFLNLRNIPWRISEADIEIPNIEPETLKLQADTYKKLKELFVKYKGEDFGVWGAGDKFSWLGDHPLLFDFDWNKKPAYYAVVG